MVAHFHYAHIWSISCISICSRHLVISKESSNPIFFSRKRPSLRHTYAICYISTKCSRSRRNPPRQSKCPGNPQTCKFAEVTFHIQSYWSRELKRRDDNGPGGTPVTIQGPRNHPHMWVREGALTIQGLLYHKKFPTVPLGPLTIQVSRESF